MNKADEIMNNLWKRFDELFEKDYCAMLNYINCYQRQYLTDEQLEKLDSYIMMQKIKNTEYKW